MMNWDDGQKDSTDAVVAPDEGSVTQKLMVEQDYIVFLFSCSQPCQFLITAYKNVHVKYDCPESEPTPKYGHIND